MNRDHGSLRTEDLLLFLVGDRCALSRVCPNASGCGLRAQLLAFQVARPQAIGGYYPTGSWRHPRRVPGRAPPSVRAFPPPRRYLSYWEKLLEELLLDLVLVFLMSPHL